MHLLSNAHSAWVCGGVSDQTMIVVKGSVLGGTEGAVIGGLFSMPFYAFAMGQGSSGLAILFIAAGVGAGSLLGGALGLCTGYGVCYWWGQETEVYV